MKEGVAEKVFFEIKHKCNTRNIIMMNVQTIRFQSLCSHSEKKSIHYSNNCQAAVFSRVHQLFSHLI
jgi:hypothetical protein